MFTFPYSYNNRGDVHDKIYGDYDIYYYSMRILCNYLSNLEKYQGISKIDLDDYDGKYNLGFNISNRIMVNKTELPNETVVYKLIKSLNKEHFLKFIKAYCIDTEISYTTNLNNIDMREFLMYACSELLAITRMLWLKDGRVINGKKSITRTQPFIESKDATAIHSYRI